MSGSSDFPPAEDGLRLHRRMLDHEAMASRDVCRHYLSPLSAYLDRKFPRADPHLRQTAAHEALLGYVKRPGRYNPARGLDLGAYLRMAAKRDLQSLLTREARRAARRVAWEDVEDAALAGNISQDGPLLRLVRGEEAAEREEFLCRSRAALGAQDQAVLDLIRAGERDTAAFARALGLEGRPFAEQQRQVKRAKDRVMKRLQRGA